EGSETAGPAAECSGPAAQRTPGGPGGPAPARGQEPLSRRQLRQCAHGRAGAPAPGERVAVEDELTIAEERFEVHEPFVVHHAPVAADAVVGKLLRSGLVSRGTFDAVHPRAVCKPFGSCIRESGVLRHDVVIRPVALVEAGAKQDDVAVDRDSRFLLGLLQVGDVDVPEVRNVPQIETDGLPREQVERHLVDRGALLADVERGVDIGADVLEHRDVVDRVRHRVARLAEPGLLRHLVGHVREDDWRGEERVRGHLVRDLEREIDEDRAAVSMGHRGDLLRSVMRVDLNSVVGRVFGEYTLTTGVIPAVARTFSCTCTASEESAASTSTIRSSSASGRSTTIRYSEPIPGTLAIASSIRWG